MTQNKTTKKTVASIIVSSHFLINGFLLIGAFVLIGGLIIGNEMAFDDTPDWYKYLMVILSLPWAIGSCVFIIIRKEIPRFGLPYIKGFWATIQGMFGLIVLAIVEIIAIYEFIRLL